MKHLKLFEKYDYESFYLIIDDVSKLLNNEKFNKKGILYGLQGISENEDIRNVVGTDCDVLIEMNKKDVLTLNNVQKVEYDNIDSLTKNNFKILKRIKGMGSNMFNDYRYFFQIIDNLKINDFYKFDLKEENIILYNFITEDFKKLLMNDKPIINDIDDLVKYVSKYFEMDINNLKYLLSKLLIDIAAPYRFEEEWIVMNINFKIPVNSTFHVDLESIKFSLENDDEIDDVVKYFDMLNRYKIIYI